MLTDDSTSSHPAAIPVVHDNNLSGHNPVHRQGRKRRNDPEVTNGTLTGHRPIFSSDITAASSQLPTPLNSPITPSKNILTRQLDSALAMVDPRNHTCIDQQRIAMLYDACKEMDAFFIVTHLIFCAWSAEQHVVLSQLRLDQSHLLGLMTLQQHVLQPNRNLNQEVAAALTQFPMPAYQCLTATTPQSVFLAAQVYPVKRFLSLLTQNWTATWNWSSRLEAPPSPIQLKYLLQLPSVVLQKSMYMCFVRARSTDRRWSAIASGLFEQALKDPTQTTPSVDELMAANGSQVTKPADDFCREYMTALGKYRTGQYGQLAGRPLLPQGDSTGVSSLASSRAVQQSPMQVPTQPGNLINPQAPAGWSQVSQVSPVARPSRTSHTARLPLTGHQNQATSTSATTTPAQPMLNPYTLSSQPLPFNPYANHQPVVLTGSLPQERVVNRVQFQAHAQMPQPASVTVARREGPHDPLMWGDGRFTLPTFAVPEPGCYALHQADMNTPPMDKVYPVAGVPQTKWYQYVEAILSLSQLLDVDSARAQWSFEMPQGYWARKAQSEEVATDSFTKHRKIVNRATQFRLKCIGSKTKEDLESMPVSEYCARPTQWPPHLSASVNGDMGIDFRRKIHHGADIPTDVTDFLLKGVNEVETCISFDPRHDPMTYLMIIEVTSVADRETIRSMVGKVDAAEVVASIVATLQPNPRASDDEDLVVAQSSISIDLVDPFMSCVWSTPTRSKSCRHRECFDLDAYLDSRTDHDGVTKTDQWKCPICKKDARPQSLVIDGFLTSVRKDLEAMDKLDTKAIVVSAEGVWDIKPELSIQAKKTIKSSTQTSDSHTHGARTSDIPSKMPDEPRPTSTPQTEAIIILDDD